MSIRIRLTLWYSGLLAAMLVLLGAGIYLFVNWNTYAEYKDQLYNHSENIKISPLTDFWDNLGLDIQVKPSSFDEKTLFVQIVNYKEGAILGNGNIRYYGIRIPYPDVSEKPQDGFVKRFIESNGEKYEMLTYQRRVDMPDGSLVGLLQVGVITNNEHEYMIDLRNILILSSIVVVLLAFTVGLFLASKALRPIEKVIAATQLIEKGSDLRVRIPVEGPMDEIGILVDTLNSMLSRLETAYNELDELYKSQRRFVSDASHELRTPLTTIRGNIDLLEKIWSQVNDQAKLSCAQEQLIVEAAHWELSHEAMHDISSEAKRMSRLVNDLLSLARADAGYVMEKSAIEIKPLVEDVVRRAGLLPRSADWKAAQLEALDDVFVEGNHDYLQQLLFIFIENAFKYTDEGYVELSAKHEQNQIGISIKDTGIGMDAAEVPYIFERFYRADESRGVKIGTGLGLSIAKWIIDEHKGSVEVVTQPNGGTTFTIWLPAAFPDLTSSTIIEE